MGLRDQLARVQAMGSAVRDELFGEELEFSDGADVRYLVRGVMSGIREESENSEGGLLVEHDGQVRVSKVDVTPEVGWLVRRVSGGRVYKVEVVTYHDGSGEWKLDVSAA